VTVCVPPTAAPHPPTAGASTKWQNGWIVFSDPNGNEKVDAGGDRIAHPAGLLRRGHVSRSTSSKLDRDFQQRRICRRPAQSGVTLTLHDSTGNAAFTRCLAITWSG